jgi:uncharacterized membrane protein
MYFRLLFDAYALIQMHFFFAISDFFIGALQLLGRKETIPYKVLDRLWVAMMFIICITFFCIKELMPCGIF